MKENLKTKISGVYNNVVLHWKTPALGRYVPYKEILAYGFGGMGVQFVLAFASQITLNATSFLVGNTIGIKPMHLQLMSIFMSLLGLTITIARSYIIDSAHLKMGKFRPWLAIMGIPAVVTAVVFVWLPYETMSYMEKCVAVFICYFVLQCFFPFFNQSYTDLANVISPNSHERTDIVSVASIIYSMAPTLTGLFIPMLAQLTGGLNNIRTYRIIHPIVAIVGVALAYLAVLGTKERIVVAKTHVTTFKFTDAFRCVAKNKYFWITSLAGWLGFLEGAVGVILGWTFIYGYPERMGTYGFATTIIGNAALWAMLICPIAIRTIGKRNLLIWCNMANIFIIGLLLPFYENIYMLILLYYLNGFVNSFSIVYNPGINADIRDYQQWYTGERIDGMFGAVGIIGSFIGMFTGMVLPIIYQKLGLEDNYDVLEVASFREDMFEVLIIAAVIGAFLNMVPYFFYDLTETKQKGIVKVLKIRALFEDYGNGILKDENLVEAIDIMDEAKELYAERQNMTTEDDITAAKRLPSRTPEEKLARKEAIEKAKQGYKDTKAKDRQEARDRIAAAKAKPESERKAALKAARKENRKLKKLSDDISVCDFVVDEMHKFSTERIQLKVQRAKKIIAEGENGIRNDNGKLLKLAKAMPKTTYDERQIRNDALSEGHLMVTCSKNIKKYYPKGLVIPEKGAIAKAEELPENTLSEKLHKRKIIKKLISELSNYNKSVKILLDAERLLKEETNYQHLDEIREKYNEALERVKEKNAAQRAELQKIEEERKAELELRKAERAAKRKNGGNN